MNVNPENDITYQYNEQLLEALFVEILLEPKTPTTKNRIKKLQQAIKIEQFRLMDLEAELEELHNQASLNSDNNEQPTVTTDKIEETKEQNDLTPPSNWGINSLSSEKPLVSHAVQRLWRVMDRKQGMISSPRFTLKELEINSGLSEHVVTQILKDYPHLVESRVRADGQMQYWLGARFNER